MSKVDRPEVRIYCEFDNLLWPLHLETPEGKQQKGLVLSANEEGKEVVWVSSHGEIYRSLEEGTHSVSDQEFTTLIYGATRAIQVARRAQIDELKETEGKMVIWRPGHPLLGQWYIGEERLGNKPEPKQVFVKKGELYCPRHTNSRLTTTYDHGEDRRTWLVCSEKNCFFDVYLGT